MTETPGRASGQPTRCGPSGREHERELKRRLVDLRELAHQAGADLIASDARVDITIPSDLHATAEQGAGTLAVEDDGPGDADEIKNRVLGAFERGSANEARDLGTKVPRMYERQPEVRSVAPFEPPGGFGWPWPCTNCGKQHPSGTSWVARLARNDREWSIILCGPCAQELADG